MAEETINTTVGTLASIKAKCNVVGTDENGVVVLSQYPQMTDGTCIGGGGISKEKG